MTVGDLVRVHWGNCDWSGEEGIDWGYASGIVIGDIAWWDPSEPRARPCGDVLVFVQGQETSYNIGRLEIISEAG